MNSSVSSKPLIKAGWLRVLLYLLALMIVTGTVLTAFLLGAFKGNLDVSGLQEMMKGMNPGMIALILFTIALIITYVFRRWVDGKSFTSLGLEWKGHGRESAAGAALAIFIVSSSCLIIQLAGHLKWMDILFDPQSLFLAFGAVVLSAFYEELIFRGYVLNNLMDNLPNWLALSISSVLYMGFHWNPDGLFPVLNLLIMGGTTGLFYLYNRNLWFPVCFHAAWKFMAGPVLGFSNDPSSHTLLQASLQGNENITGGANGLQGSVILSTVSLLSAVALYFILQKKISPVSLPVPDRI